MSTRHGCRSGPISPLSWAARVLACGWLAGVGACGGSTEPPSPAVVPAPIPAVVAPAVDELLASEPARREAAARKAAGQADRADALAGALERETEAEVKLVMAVALARAGDLRGLSALAAMTEGNVPHYRREADARLRDLAKGESPPLDPLAGPDTGAWAAWVATQRVAPDGMADLLMP